MSEPILMSVEGIASCYSRRLLCKFGEFHKTAEQLVGHPIWTHEFASRDLESRLKDLSLAKLPQLSDYEFTKESWEDDLCRLKEDIGGDTILSNKEVNEREKTPMKTLEEIAPGKPHIFVEV